MLRRVNRPFVPPDEMVLTARHDAVGVAWEGSGPDVPDLEGVPVSIVVINALKVPVEAGSELEKRFAARKHSVDGSPGFEGFQLLRPVAGDDRYFVYTQWATREDFENWRDQRPGHDHSKGAPVATGMELLEFEVVDLSD